MQVIILAGLAEAAGPHASLAAAHSGHTQLEVLSQLKTVTPCERQLGVAAVQVIIAGPPDAAETEALLAVAHAGYAPDRLVLPIDPAKPASREWYAQHNPEAWAMVAGASKEVGPFTVCDTAVILKAISVWSFSTAPD